MENHCVGAVIAPEGRFWAGLREAVEDLLIQAFISQAAVEAFDQVILLWLAGVDIVPGHAGIARPFEDRGAGEPGAGEPGAGEPGAPPWANDLPDRLLIFVDR